MGFAAPGEVTQVRFLIILTRTQDWFQAYSWGRPRCQQTPR